VTAWKSWRTTTTTTRRTRGSALLSRTRDATRSSRLTNSAQAFGQGSIGVGSPKEDVDCLLGCRAGDKRVGAHIRGTAGIVGRAARRPARSPEQQADRKRPDRSRPHAAGRRPLHPEPPFARGFCWTTGSRRAIGSSDRRGRDRDQRSDRHGRSLCPRSRHKRLGYRKIGLGAASLRVPHRSRRSGWLNQKPRAQ
jgi:hypothetical protein